MSLSAVSPPPPLGALNTSSLSTNNSAATALTAAPQSLSAAQLSSIANAATVSASLSIIGSLLVVLLFIASPDKRPSPPPSTPLSPASPKKHGGNQHRHQITAWIGRLVRGNGWYFGRKQMLSRMVFCIALSDLVSAVAYFIGRRGSEAGTGSALCTTQSFMEQWGDLASIFFTGSLAFNLVRILYFKQTSVQLQRAEKVHFAVNFGASFLVAVVPMLITAAQPASAVYGADTLWCWITDEWPALRFALFYIPLWAVFAFSLVMYAVAGRELYRRAYPTAPRFSESAMAPPEWPTPCYTPASSLYASSTASTAFKSPLPSQSGAAKRGTHLLLPSPLSASTHQGRAEWRRQLHLSRQLPPIPQKSVADTMQPAASEGNAEAECATFRVRDSAEWAALVTGGGRADGMLASADSAVSKQLGVALRNAHDLLVTPHMKGRSAPPSPAAVSNATSRTPKTARPAQAAVMSPVPAPLVHRHHHRPPRPSPPSVTVTAPPQEALPTPPTTTAAAGRTPRLRIQTDLPILVQPALPALKQHQDDPFAIIQLTPPPSLLSGHFHVHEPQWPFNLGMAGTANNRHHHHHHHNNHHTYGRHHGHSGDSSQRPQRTNSIRGHSPRPMHKTSPFSVTPPALSLKDSTSVHRHHHHAAATKRDTRHSTTTPSSMSSSASPPPPHQHNSHHQHHRQRPNYRTVYLQKVLAYLLAFLLTWTCATVNRVQNYMAPGQPSYTLSLMQASTTPLRGMFNFCAYFVTGVWLAA